MRSVRPARRAQAKNQAARFQATSVMLLSCHATQLRRILDDRFLRVPKGRSPGTAPTGCGSRSRREDLSARKVSSGARFCRIFVTQAGSVSLQNQSRSSVKTSTPSLRTPPESRCPKSALPEMPAWRFLESLRGWFGAGSPWCRSGHPAGPRRSSR